MSEILAKTELPQNAENLVKIPSDCNRFSFNPPTPFNHISHLKPISKRSPYKCASNCLYWTGSFLIKKYFRNTENCKE